MRLPGRLTMLAVMTLIAALAVVATPARSEAAPSGAFNAEYLISDANFYDSRSMDEGAIQAFLISKSCSPRDGVPCLADYRQDTQSRGDAGANQCGAYAGGAAEPASRIIAKVAQACGISPKVLLVLVQKEQSLITNPSARGYQYATGANCPDTPQGCDAAYSGFFIQVYSAAWQFRQYAKYPNSWRYKIGPSYVQYSTNTACGGSTLNIRNQATANLYIYTPYQPNAAALANLYGTGDACSTYGNRNFWRTYFDWFGSPTDASPIGAVENMQPVPGGIGVWGWVVDTDTPDPIMVHVYVDGQIATGGLADTPWANVNQRFGSGDRHGFVFTAQASPGDHRVCVYALNVGSGSNTELVCSNVRAGGGNPVGAVENIQPQPGGLGIWGHAVDPDTTEPIWLHVYVDGSFAGGYLADVARADVAQRYPGNGDRHGFGIRVPAALGSHRVCVYALNVGAGTANTEIGCATASVGGDPVGALSTVSSGLQRISVAGWAVDPDTTNPISVHVYVDGRMAAGLGADRPGSDTGIYGAFGNTHGYAVDLPASNGRHEVCVYAINVGSGRTNTQIGCRAVDVGGNPVGRVENGQPGFASIGVWGWAYDLDTPDPIGVHIYMDGKIVAGATANALRPDASEIPAEYGDGHGFGATFPASPGSHRVCAYALNTGHGNVNTEIGCFTTTVSGTPVGAIENIQHTATGFGVWGYAVDPDTSVPIPVHIYVDGAFAGGAVADQFRSDLAQRFPGFGGSHAFGTSVPAGPGNHRVCAYAINTPAGTNPVIGCVDVVRP
ncbi:MULTISPECIES: hypothetical protein [Microbacterium]|uniref:hypothetical protein n=1 Tax=Microbacterium TaxID=33882 RepID=UPI0013A54B08|nr:MULTISPECIES: hypothetical protein [Microbacterium]